MRSPLDWPINDSSSLVTTHFLEPREPSFFLTHPSTKWNCILDQKWLCSGRAAIATAYRASMKKPALSAGMSNVQDAHSSMEQR
jgi:hypothetical protein